MVHHVLDEHERRELIAQGNAAFVELLGRLFSSEAGTKPRRHHRARKPSTGSRDSHRNDQSAEDDAYISLYDRHAIRATLDEVADLYLNEDKKMVLDFSESRELVALLKPSARAPLEYTGVRWSLYRSPNRAVAKDQDFCYLEVMKPFTSPSGRRGWLKCSHSIDHRICPDLSGSPKIAVNRGRLHYCGVFFLETDDPGVLEAIFHYNVARANIPALLAPVVMKARGRNNAQLLNHYAKMARLAVQQQQQGGMSSGAKAAFAKQLHAERRCGACSDRLPGWKARAKCVFCRAYMCKKCSVIVQRNYRVRDIGRNHVCFSCAEQHGARLAQTSSAKTVDDAGSDVGSEVFHFDYTDTTASSAYGGDDVLSVATATDDESEGDDLLHHHAAANGTATRLTRRRSSSGSTSSAARARSASGIQYVLVDPAVVSPKKHADAPVSRSHRAATTTSAASSSSDDHLPLQKTRSVPHMSSTARRLDVHGAQQLHVLDCSGRPPPPLPVPAYQRHFPRQRPASSDKIAAAIAGSADLGSPKGLNLDQVNLRHRSQTTSAVPSHGEGDHRDNQRERAATAAAPARDKLVDLSYLSGFK